MNETEALVLLTHTPNLGNSKIHLLLRQFGSASRAIETSAADLLCIPGFTEKSVEAWGFWKTDSSWMRNLELVKKWGAEVITFQDSHYPKPLQSLADAPLVLYVKGKLLPEDAHAIAIVGTRSASPYGLKMAKQFGKDLAAHGFTVVSGLAKGVDTGAHAGAIETGRTIAVLGSGIAKLYPKENLSLAKKIVENGAIISEYRMDAPPDRHQFPQRNRIISGLSRGTLLIEAPEKSGALITMNHALKQGRELFAIPGRCDEPNFKGNHTLLKQKQTHLVTSSADIAQSYIQTALLYGSDNKKTLPLLHPDEVMLLKVLPIDELTIEEIAHLTKLPITKLQILLMSLVTKKAIKESPGKVYKRLISIG